MNALTDVAAQDPRILLLTGDLGYSVLEPFRDRFPRRFINVGVAEQNLIGVATGLAESGFVPFVYSIATFAVLRPFEFIRNGPIHHNLPVRIVGVGEGFDYAINGASHYGLEDVGVLRTQPGIRVIVPADAEQARTALEATWNLPGPTYYRLGKDEGARVPGLDGRFELARATMVRPGRDLVMIAMGSLAAETVAAAHALERRGFSCAVLVVASIAPPPVELADVISRFPQVLTVEGHYEFGGLGSLVSEVIAEHALGCRLVRCGIQGPVGSRIGTRAYLHARHGLTSEALEQTALRALGPSGEGAGVVAS